jgi:hypothetical protein
MTSGLDFSKKKNLSPISGLNQSFTSYIWVFSQIWEISNFCISRGNLRWKFNLDEINIWDTYRAVSNIIFVSNMTVKTDFNVLSCDMTGGLIDWLFTVLRPIPEYFTYVETSAYRRRAAKFRPMLGTQGLWAGRDLYRATPAVTRGLGFSGLIRRTAIINRLLRHTRWCGRSILTQIPTWGGGLEREILNWSRLNRPIAHYHGIFRHALSSSFKGFVDLSRLLFRTPLPLSSVVQI